MCGSIPFLSGGGSSYLFQMKSSVVRHCKLIACPFEKCPVTLSGQGDSGSRGFATLPNTGSNPVGVIKSKACRHALRTPQAAREPWLFPPAATSLRLNFERKNQMPDRIQHQVHDNMSLEDSKRRLIQRCLIEDFVEQALASLSRKESVIFRMYYLYGFTSTDIAAVLGVVPSSAARRLKRIADKLEKIYTSDRCFDTLAVV